MLLRLPYLALASVVTLIRLLSMSDVDKNVEILALRHQLAVLQRQIERPSCAVKHARSLPLTSSRPGL